MIIYNIVTIKIDNLNFIEIECKKVQIKSVMVTALYRSQLMEKKMFMKIF